MTDLFGEASAPEKKKTKARPSPNPVGLELVLLDNLLATWGPMVYVHVVWMTYFVDKSRRATEGLIREAFLSCIQARWLHPLGTSFTPSVRGNVVWGLTNPRKYRVYVPAIQGQRQSCKVWEVETGERCICCRLGPLPSDGHDPGLPTEESLW